MARAVLTLLIILGLANAGAALTVAQAGAAERAVAERLLEEVNAARATAGLGPVVLAAALSRAAQAHADDLAGNGDISHTGSDGASLGDRLGPAGYVYRVAAENLAMGVNTPARAMAMWLESPGHRGNILMAEAREMGVGHAIGKSRRPGVASGGFWVLMLGQRL